MVGALRIGKATTAQVEAFELVAKGRALAAKRGLSLVAARECLERAIVLDPENAEAHAALGDTLVNLVRYGLLPMHEVVTVAKAALARALDLEPAMVAALATRGVLSLQLEHDPSEALHWCDRALALQPRMVEVRATYALQGLMFARQDDARGLAELARAVRDDPLSALCATLHGAGLLIAGRFAEAASEGARACEIDPESFLALYGRVWILSGTGDARGTLAAATQAFARIGRHPLVLMSLPMAYVRLGDMERAEAVYTELQARSKTEELSRMTRAIAADAVGRVDEAIAYAIESVQRCDNTLSLWTRSAFASEAMRAHARYPELLRTMGL